MLICNGTSMNAERFDLRVVDGTIAEMSGELQPYQGEEIIDANGGAVLPALHDHHIHLLALAAGLDSFDCAEYTNEAALVRGLRAAIRGRPTLRAVNYHESIAGSIDRTWLDIVTPDVPVRVQHRSGRLWILNSAALASVGPTTSAGQLEYQKGASTGRIYDGDTWLRPYFKGQNPNLARVGQLLAQRGVTAVTDATPSNDQDFFTIVASAQANGDLPQRVAVMGTPAVATGPKTADLFPLALKLHLHEGDYPEPETFFALIRHAKSQGLALAVHCVTEADLVFTVSLLEESGYASNARIEHASMIPPYMIVRLAAAGVTVVTQPHFIAERGDAYVRDIAAAEHDHLYRCATLQSEGVKLGGGTDAPFGHWDPWLSIAAATMRCTPGGTVLGPAEILSPEAALALYTTPLTDPGGTPRRLEPGKLADVCVLSQPWSQARGQLSAVRVQATIRGGSVIHNNAAQMRWGRKVA